MAHIFFEHQAEEKVVLQTHRHWFVFFRDFVRMFFLALLPLPIYWAARHALGWELQPGTLGYVLLAGIALGYYFFIWVLLYGFWLDYFLDYYMVTNKRLVDVEQSGLFSRTIAEQPLYRIQDVTSEVRGVLPSMLGYGSVFIQTAGTKERFVFEEVPHPEEVVRLILSLTDKLQTVPPEASPAAEQVPPVKR